MEIGLLSYHCVDPGSMGGMVLLDVKIPTNELPSHAGVGLPTVPHNLLYFTNLQQIIYYYYYIFAQFLYEI